MSVVGGQPKKKNKQIPVIKQQNTSNALFLSSIITGQKTVPSVKTLSVTIKRHMIKTDGSRQALKGSFCTGFICAWFSIATQA